MSLGADSRSRNTTEDDDNQSSSDRASGESPASSTGEAGLYSAICDFAGEQVADLPFKKGDILKVLAVRADGWCEAVDERGAKGWVPSTFLKPRRAAQRTETREQSGITSASIPFELPSYGFLIYNDDRFSIKHSITPTLNSFNTEFRDLFWDESLSTVKRRSVAFQRIVTLIACKNIVQLGPPNIEVGSRHVRLCLFDGTRILSNVHTVQAKWDSKSPKLWTFSNRASSCIQEAELFVRTPKTSLEMSILFELCVSYTKTGTREDGGFSCGWARVPLFEDSGVASINRTYKVDLHFGSPFKAQRNTSDPKGVNLKRVANQKRTKPYIVLKVGRLSKASKSQLEALTDPLIGCMSWIPLLYFHRQVAAHIFLGFSSAFVTSAELLHCPFLATFPLVMDCPDIVDALQLTWSERVKRDKLLKKVVFKDLRATMQAFQESFLSVAFVLYHSLHLLPPYTISDKLGITMREEVIKRVTKEMKKGAAAILLSSEVDHEPFQVQELAVDPQEASRHLKMN